MTFGNSILYSADKLAIKKPKILIHQKKKEPVIPALFGDLQLRLHSKNIFQHLNESQKVGQYVTQLAPFLYTHNFLNFYNVLEIST